MQIKQGFIFDPSLVLYLPLYELDGNSFMSKDARGHLCTVTGARWELPGRLLDGVDDQINIGDPASLNITDNIAVEAWVKTNFDWGTGYSYGYILSKANYNLYAQKDGPTNRLRFEIVDGGTDYSAYTLSALSAAITNTYTHIVGVYDGATVQIFVNGSNANTTPAAHVGDIDDASGNNLRVGVDAAQVRFLKGYAGEIRIYNRALTQLEIQHNYLATKWRYR